MAGEGGAGDAEGRIKPGDHLEGDECRGRGQSLKQSC